MLLLHSFAAMAMAQQQKNDYVTEQSSSMDIPQKKLSFTEAWVWAYTNSDGSEGEMVVYREPQTGYWLFTPEAYGSTDEMTEWIVANNDGVYIFAYNDAELYTPQKRFIVNVKLKKFDKLPEEWQLLSGSQYFGDALLGFPRFKGTAYETTYLKTTERSIFYVAATQADLSAIYYFNHLNIDAKLPVSFPENIPGRQIVLSEQTKFATGNMGYRFRHISHTTYQINLSDDEQ